MFLTYHPEGQAEPKRWVINLGKLRVFDTEAIERVTGMAYGSEFKQRLLLGNITARRALLWVLLRKEHPTIKYADIDFAEDELQLEHDKDELRKNRDEIEASPDLPAFQKAAALSQLDREIAEAPDAPGKAPSSESATNTDSTSPTSSEPNPGTSTDSTTTS